MENNTLQFKTNINCGSCVETVKPFLDNEIGNNNWSVDTTNKDKILSVHSIGITADEVIKTVQKAGYKIELVQ